MAVEPGDGLVARLPGIVLLVVGVNAETERSASRLVDICRAVSEAESLLPGRRLAHRFARELSEAEDGGLVHPAFGAIAAAEDGIMVILSGAVEVTVAGTTARRISGCEAAAWAVHLLPWPSGPVTMASTGGGPAARERDRWSPRCFDLQRGTVPGRGVTLRPMPADGETGARIPRPPRQEPRPPRQEPRPPRQEPAVANRPGGRVHAAPAPRYGASPGPRASASSATVPPPPAPTGAGGGAWGGRPAGDTSAYDAPSSDVPPGPRATGTATGTGTKPPAGPAASGDRILVAPGGMLMPPALADTVVPGAPELRGRDIHYARRWWILALAGLTQLLVILDGTIVNIALPSAQQELVFSDGSRMWLITAYALPFGSLLPLGGRLCDLLGHKRALLIAAAGFAVASAVGGAAPNFATLVGARAAQGVFGALLAPVPLALLATTFTDPRERGRAFGVFGAIAGTGGVLGLLLGGALTSYASWRWCLYVNVAFAAVIFLGGLVLLHHQAAPMRPKLDLPGAFASSIGLFAVVYGLANAESRGWGDVLTIGCFVAGIALLILFVWLETRVAHPLLPLRVILDRNRGGSFLAVFVFGAGIFVVFLFLTFYLQAARGYSPVGTGLAFLPMVVALSVSANVATNALLPRTGPRPLVPAGMLMAALGMVLLTRLDLQSTYVLGVLPALVVTGIGLGLVISPSIETATSGIAGPDTGVASAMVTTSQQIGGSIGTALLSSIFASAMAGYLAAQAGGVAPTPELVAAASVAGYTTVFWYTAVIFAVGAVVTGLLLRGGVGDRGAARSGPPPV
nr:EspT1-like putative transporter [uncultured bacterium]